MKYNAKRPCGVCGNTNVEYIWNLKFKLPIHIKLPNNYNIVYCHDCGFVYGDTWASQDYYDIFYRKNNIYENSASYSDMQKYKLTYDYLQKFVSKEKSILDIGFANGELLKMFKTEGYEYLYGLDTSKSCVDNLKKKFTVYQGSLLNHNVQDKFDSIILSHVIEHILDIKQAMNNLRNLLKEDGILYLEVPDLLQYQENNASPFNYFDIEHINHFNEKSLISLVQLNGFSVIDSGTKKWNINPEQYYPATYVLCRKKLLEKPEGLYEYVQDYVETCLSFNYDEIDELVKSQEPIIIWGTGSFSQRLYQMSTLAQCNIQKFVDNNTNKIGKLFDEKAISSPDCIDTNDTILILSVYGSEEIKNQIKEMGLNNKIIIPNTWGN